MNRYVYADAMDQTFSSECGGYADQTMVEDKNY